MESYSAVIPTLLRPNKLERCLESLSTIPDGYRPDAVVVADDSKQSSVIDDPSDYLEQRANIERTYAESLPLEIVDLPADSGRSKKLNVGIDRTTAPYILILDDDTYPPSNVYELVDVLEQNPDIGGVAPYLEEEGQIHCNAGDYYDERGWMLKDSREEKQPERTDSGQCLYRYDQIPPIGMFRRAVFEDYTWDNEYLGGLEDTDFFLKHHELGEWEFVITPNYIIRHDPGPGSIDVYFDERRNVSQQRASARRLAGKFDIKGFFQTGAHLELDRPLADKITRWVGINLVPYRLLWWIKQTKVGHLIQKYALSSYR